MQEYTWRHNARRVIAVAEDILAARRPVALAAGRHVHHAGLSRNEIAE
jgi:hypothetical protein